MRYILLSGLLLSIAYLVQAQTERTLSFWNYNKCAIQVSNKTFVEAAEKIHYNMSSEIIDYRFGQLLLVHQAANWLVLSGGLKLAQHNQETGWLNETRPMFAGELYKQIKSIITLRYKNRIEYRNFRKAIAEDHFRYYQRLSIDLPTIPKIYFRPFLAGETYIKLNREDFHMTRLFAGVNAFESNVFAMKLYYGLEKKKNGLNWGTNDIIGLNLSFEI